MFNTVILTADKLNITESANSFVLQELSFQPLVKWVVDATVDSGKQIITDIPCCDKLSDVSDKKVEFIQNPFLDSVSYIADCDDVLFIKGNMSLVTCETIRDAYDFHKKSDNSLTFLSSEVKKNIFYGCFIASDALLRLSELLENKICCTECCLDAVIDFAVNEGIKVGSYDVKDSEELFCVTNCVELSTAQKIMRDRIVKKHLLNGVVFLSPETAFVGKDVEIDIGTVIMPNVIIKGKTKIGKECVIGPNSQISDSTISDNVEFNNSVILESFVGEKTTVGPFAYIRPHSKIGKNIKIGDFVEIKNATIDDGTKVSHLTYVGDADVGKNVNFGCGTVLVNYDGSKKHRSTIDDNAFIGCNTNIVSPVNVKQNAFIAAGSTITDDVPEDSLAIARARQVVKTNWKKKNK